MRIVIPRIVTMAFHEAYDGGCKLFDYLARDLVRKGNEVTIVTSVLEDEKECVRFKDGVKYVFIKPRYLGKRLTRLNVPYKLWFSWNLVKYLDSIDFDVLHNSESFAYFYLMRNRRKRKPVITQAHGLEPFYGPVSLAQKGLKKLYVKLFLQHPWHFCLTHSEKVASEGEFQTPWLTRIDVKEKNIFPLYNGINVRDIWERKKNFKDKRKELGIGKDDLLILNINVFLKDKCLDEIVKSFALVKKEEKNAKLILIGKGPTENEIHKLIRDLGIERDVFHLKNIPEDDLYNHHFSADVFVSSTANEDFMMSIQEAMAAGLPIVSSAQPMLVNDGINGYVVGLHNPPGLKDGILKIWRDKKKRKEMGEASEKMALMYDWDNISDIAIREYKKLL